MNNNPPEDPKQNGELKVISDTYMDLLSVLESRLQEEKIDPESQDLLYNACHRICKHIGIPIQPLPKDYFNAPVTVAKYLEELNQFNPFRYRMETLKPDWWQKDCGSLLAFRTSDKEPLALIRKRNQYYYYDSQSRTNKPITKTLITSLEPEVYFFYKTLPEKPLHWKDLFFFVFKNVLPDFKMVFILQFIMGTVGLLIPIFTKIIFESIIPNADITHLKQLSWLLGIAMTSVGLFKMAEVIYSLRMRYHSNITLESAVWDRILRSPISFTQQFSAGDLAQRASGIDHIQQHISTSIFTTAMSGIFSIMSLALMFYFDLSLGLYALLFVVIIFLIEVALTILLLRYQRPFIALQGKLAGLVFELLTGISKIRVANRESQVFKVWGTQFTEKNSLFFKAGLIELLFHVIFPFLSVIGTAVLFVFVVQRGTALSFGDFMGFSAAFIQFLTAFLALTGVLTSVLEIFPFYERVKPILQVLPEKEDNQSVLTEFKGAINLENLSFRYHQDLPLVLENINLTIHPGEFVAIVGATGSGKSTLFRLLMGFETPLKGHVYYDDHEINTINLRALRKSFGTVLQNSTLLPGSIFENLSALNPDLTIEDAWRACELMEIADEIRDMPMGLHTLLSEYGRNISVGQRQRIMLARALIHQPKVLFLDEATSALDNSTQAKIHENLSKLNITRIAIAHRISAIKKADRIYVIDNGRVQESGNFEELIKNAGLFANFWKKQYQI